jgi:hypothetical protein
VRSLNETKKRIGGLTLDSPGGSVAEAESLAAYVSSGHATVGVLSGAQCSSACFLIFAAGSNRFMEADALLGVHSASLRGEETTSSMAATTLMARDAAALGVPPAIIGKMVQTVPGRMEWLTPHDLALMDVKVLDADMPAKANTVTAAPTSLAATTPALPAAAPQQESPTFQQGLEDRRRWEQWFGTLQGDTQAGAEYWSAHRSDPKLPSCYGAGGQSLGGQTAGCLAAQQRLAASDVRRKTEPDYRRGWNSL